MHIEFSEEQIEELVDTLLDLANDDLELVLRKIKDHVSVTLPDGSVSFSEVDPDRLCHEVQRAVDDKDFDAGAF